ncbi:MAG: DUF3795 domain-containing protein [Clostridium sp.]|nr:DUF3795 domain-containing protein [Clostridium sp.]
MEKITACCGCICDECSYYLSDCRGCPELEGKPFWLQYTGGTACGIYQCCINEKKLPHCGKCEELPCKHFETADPSRTPEEHAEGLKAMIKVLRSLG